MTQLPSIGKPAKHALEAIGITTLEQVSTLDTVSLLKIHGVDYKALTILEKALKDQNLAFQLPSSDDTVPQTDFAVIGSLNCDNAPKRKIIRDYLIAAASGNLPLLNTILSDSFYWIVPGKKPLEGKDLFIKMILKEQKELSTLEIKSILTHGKEGAAHGILTTKTGDKVYFSTIFRFKNHQKNAPISEITSFIIQ